MEKLFVLSFGLVITIIITLTAIRIIKSFRNEEYLDENNSSKGISFLVILTFIVLCLVVFFGISDVILRAFD